MTGSKKNTKTDKKLVKKKDTEIVKIAGERFLKQSFMVEEDHPVIGRILIVDDIKFKIMNAPYDTNESHRKGTFIKRLTEQDEELMREYDEDVDALAEKLVLKVDIKRIIKENIRQKPYQSIKTGLFILKQEENGEEIEEEHAKGCYQYVIHHKNQTFDLIVGNEYLNDERQ